MKNVIKQILDFASEWGLRLAVDDDGRWLGKKAKCIGIPTKNQKKRKIWRGFFWLIEEEDSLFFYAPNTYGPSDLTKSYGLDVQKTYSKNRPDNTMALRARMSQVDLGGFNHRGLMQYVINSRAEQCGRKLNASLAGDTGGCS